MLNAIQSRDLLSNVQTRSDQLFTALHAKLGQHPNIGDIRGRELSIGLEIVKDRDIKEPLDPALKTAATF